MTLIHRTPPPSLRGHTHHQTNSHPTPHDTFLRHCDKSTFLQGPIPPSQSHTLTPPERRKSLASVTRGLPTPSSARPPLPFPVTSMLPNSTAVDHRSTFPSQHHPSPSTPPGQHTLSSAVSPQHSLSSTLSPARSLQHALSSTLFPETLPPAPLQTPHPSDTHTHTHTLTHTHISLKRTVPSTFHDERLPQLIFCPTPTQQRDKGLVDQYGSPRYPQQNGIPCVSVNPAREPTSHRCSPSEAGGGGSLL